MERPLKQRTHLVAREDQCIGDHHVFWPGGGKDDDLCDIVSDQRIDTPRRQSEYYIHYS